MAESYICGVHAVLAALTDHPDRIDEVWIGAGRADKRMAAVRDAARAAQVKVHQVPRVALDRMSQGVKHQGVLARARAAPMGNASDLENFLSRLPPQPLLLVLDGVQDPHNLGACLRSACAAGAHAVILPRERSAPISAVAHRAASGAADRIPVFQVINLARTLRDLKQAGIWLAGASPQADTDIFHADLRRPLALVLGGEGRGLRRLTREACDLLVRIPMTEAVESLNVSVAAGICLFEVMRQRTT